MKIIIGLGNPGKKYIGTRHNTGFMTLDYISKQLLTNGFKFSKKFNAEITELRLKKEKVLLIKPQTFMNRSGESVKNLVSFYKLDPEKDILVIYDDIDLPLGKIKTKGRRAAGHKGMQSIINALGTDKIKRIRIGICPLEGKSKIPTDKFVLQKFKKEEKKIIYEIIKKVTEKIKKYLFSYLPAANN